MTIEERITILEQKLRRHTHDDIETPRILVEVDYSDILNTPTIPASSGWDLVSTASLSSAATLTLSSLTGNTDKLYKLILRANFSTAADFYLRFNASSTAAYHYVFGAGDSGTIAQSEILLPSTTYTNHFLELLIHATSGIPRLVVGSITSFTDNENYTHKALGSIWTNTANEITSINITASQNFNTGSEYWFYKSTNA